MAENPTLVVFDLCDTLYAENTTVGFIRHYAAATRNREIEMSLRRWLNRKSPVFYLGAAAYRVAGYDIARKQLIAALAGETRERLVAIAGDYARALPRVANAAVHERLERHRAAGDRIVLVSSSLDIVVEAVAALLQTEFTASTLHFSGDICTGRLARDLTGKKGAVVRELMAGAQNRLKVYTDNRSDRALVTMADEATIIVPRGTRTTQWAGSGCEYLEL